jgi:hypothetical protein
LLAFPTTHHAPLPQMTYLKESRIASRLNESFATLSPQEQTSPAGPVRSEKCHEPTCAMYQLFNDFVRKTHVRKVEPKCLGSLEIDSHLKLCWLHDRQFGRLLAL